MKRIHVKNGMKKALALSLAAAMVIPSAIAAGSLRVSAAETVPEPVKEFSMDKGFRLEGLKQAGFGQIIGMVEDVYPASSPYAEMKYFDPQTGRPTGQYQLVDTVLEEGSFKTSNTGEKDFKGYKQVAIPDGAKKQYLPEPESNTGEWQQLNPAPNQPTTAYDKEKGMVFWLDDTWTNESYPTYATTMLEDGNWKTIKELIVRDTKGQSQEYDINNSAAEFDNPFAGTSATGFTFSAWIKNTTPYNAPVVYEKLGDLTGDGKVNSEDASIILKYDVSMVELSEIGQLYADVNYDHKVNSEDASDILKYDVNVIKEFKAPEPEIGGGEEEVVAPLKDSEFFHVEYREIGEKFSVELKDGKLVETEEKEKDERNIQKRQYLYFSGNGVTYVGDFTDPKSACTWTLDEELLNDETLNILNGKNGGKWNYVSYTFDGTNFHMYVNGKEAKLIPDAGDNYDVNGIMKFVTSKDAVTYLGGRGGGLKGDINPYKIGTSKDYYMDDVALYTSGFSAEQAKQAYDDAVEAWDAVRNKKATVLKTYHFDGTSLKDDELTAVPEAVADCLPKVGVEGKSGKGIMLNKSYQSETGGVQLAENPFAREEGKESDLTGVTISYWLKAVGKGSSGTVTDGLVFSFIDDEHECFHGKVTGGNYTGPNARAKSQLYLNQAFIGAFCEGVTKGIGANSLKNTYSYAPYAYGPKVSDLETWKQQFEKYADEFKALRNGLANDWNFITVTFNNAGFVMYLNGKEVVNRKIDFQGLRFCDYYWGRTVEITRKATDNAGARSLMDFLTASDTKAYIGFAYAQSSSTAYETTSQCYLDELSFYDKDMSAAEVKALYDSVK